MNNLQRVFRRGHIRNNKNHRHVFQKYHEALHYFDIERHVRGRRKINHATSGNTSVFHRLRNVMVSKICMLLNIHELKQAGKCFISLNSENWLINSYLHNNTRIPLLGWLSF